MDDPWAAPSWSTPAQPSGSGAGTKPLSFSPPRSPPGDLGGDDPWGAPVSAASTSMAFPRDPIEQPRSHDADASPGWGGGGDGWGGGMDFSVPTSLPTIGGQEASPEPPTWEIPTTSPNRTSADGDEAVDMQYEATAVEPNVNLDSGPPSPIPTPKEAPPRFPSPPPLDLPISRSDTPAVPVVIEDDDPEAAFAAALPRAAVDDMPKFDISGSSKQKHDDEGRFGGFSDEAFGATDVSWTGKAAALDEDAGGWAPDPAPVASITSPRLDSREEVEEDGWGSSRVAATVQETYDAPPRKEMDWEAAQRRIQLQDRMMPLEQINQLKKQWTDASTEVFSKSVSKAGSRITAAPLDGSQDPSREALRNLSTIPSDINTYPPVLSSFQTYTTYQTRVSRANPTPSTSILLSTTSAARRARRDPAGQPAGPSAPWLSRSRLGEPEAPTAALASDLSAEGAKSKWSFWGKKPEPKPLVTSGEGVLEIKTPGTATPAMAPTRPGMSSRQASISMSNTSNRPSRINSPAPTSLFDEVGDIPAQLAAPGSAISLVTTTHVTSAAPQPSAVSRFFGRLGRRQSTQAAEASDANDPKDLELGADDFSFLQEVPSLAPVDKTQGDLLGIETGRTEAIASLESMISSKPVALPKPLAPPPAGPSLSSPVTRIGSSHSVRPPTRQASDMDLLSGVFGETTAPSAGNATAAAAAPAQNGVIGWDDFMDPVAAISPISPPPLTSNPPPLRTFSSPPPPAVPTKSPPRAPPLGSSFGDFDDFATPQPASIAKFGGGANDDFDDFGEFSDFAPAPAPAPAISAPTPLRQVSQDRVPFAFQTPNALQTHAPRSSLDHTPALNLLNSVNAVKGQRWPAPPAPDVPILSPPPGKSTTTAPQTSFPFLSPPPPGRPGSALAKGAQMDLFADESNANPAAVEISSSNTVPLQSTPSPISQIPAGGSNLQNKQGGLSAQDLSFFDTL